MTGVQTCALPISYLAKVRNPNPQMPDYHPLPATWEEYEKRNGNPLLHLEEEGKK